MTAAERRKLISRLGKEHDTVLAREFKVAKQYVFELRTAGGIPKHKPPTTKPMCCTMVDRDVKRTDRAAKKIGWDRSAYIRDAVRLRNKVVLDE